MRNMLYVVVFLLTSFSASARPKCVNIFYDKSDSPQYWMGKTYAGMIQNLLGHFPEYQQIVSPIESYKKGDIETCKATIYIASYFNNRVPEVFYDDYVSTKKNVAWLGYKIWNLGENLEKIFGYRYSHLSTLNYTNTDSKNTPTYYKNIHYKGEIFSKYGAWSKTIPGVFLAPFEQSILTPVQPNRSQILASARHNLDQNEVPYILRSQNHFYVADVPLSFIHEADRYFVFADLLFDILNEPPRHDSKPAFLRIEDIHALVPLSWLYKVTELLKTENVPVNISIIPLFYDPLNTFTRTEHQTYVAMNRHLPFMSYVRDIQSLPTSSFIWHGVTHQYKNIRNPHTGASGDDFEFFDANNNRPVAEDSVSYVLDKLEDGNDVMSKSGVQASIWLTPHYQASPLDYLIFARVFPWNVGRVIYYNVKATGVPTEDPRLYMQSQDPSATRLREDAFRNLKVEYDGSPWSGQMYPYEIHGDIYGQRLIPENLGNSQPFINEHVTAPRSKEEIIADAKRNRVLRDVWASFFYHPFLVTSFEEGGRGRFPGDVAELEFIIRELKKLGYRFIDINEFIKNNTVSKRPEPIYKDMP